MSNAANHPQKAAAYGFGVHCQWILEAMTEKKINPCNNLHMGGDISFHTSFSSANTGNSRRAYIKLDSPKAIWELAASYILNFFFGNFHIPMRFMKRHPVLFGSVSHIIGSSSHKKMMGVYTSSIIALVAKNLGFCWNASVLNKPRNLMSAAINAIEPKKAVTIWAHHASPIPAFIGLINKGHKSFWQWDFWKIMLLKRAVFPSTLIMLSAQKAAYCRLSAQLAKCFVNHNGLNTLCPSGCQDFAKLLK